MNEAEKKFKSKGNISKRITFPLLFWGEFEQDCVDNFDDCYSLKIKHDHEFRKTFQTLSAMLIQDVFELKQEVAELKAQLSEPKKEERKTFG